MGDPKKPRKQFESPRKLWDTTRILEEKKIRNTYGLKNKREIWRIETILRKKRQNARSLLAKPLEERKRRERELLDSMIRQGVLNENAVLDDVLTLSTNDLLERRLQTLVWRKGLAQTQVQARQFITHGHIAVNGKKVTAPSLLVPRSMESTIAYYGKPMELNVPKKAETKYEKKKERGVREEFEDVKKAAEQLEAKEKPAEKKEEVKGKKEAKPAAKGEKTEVKEEKPKEEKPKEEKPKEEKAGKPVEKKKEAPKAEEKKEEKPEAEKVKEE